MSSQVFHPAGWFRRMLACLILAATGMAAVAAEEGLQDVSGPRTALVLYSYHDRLPWQRALREGLHGKLAEYPQVQVYEERLDAIRVDPRTHEAGWLTHLRKKYAGMRFDVVISESEDAGRVLERHPDLFPGARHILVNRNNPQPPGKRDLPVQVPERLAENLALVQDLWPQTRRLVVVGNLDAERVPAVQKLWDTRFRQGVELETWTEDFTFEELYARAARLSPDTAILYALVNHDRTGKILTPYAVVEQLAARASVPVFIMHDTLLGSGAVGGMLLSARRVGQAMGELAAGTPATDFTGEYFSVPAFDARALARWKIPQTRLPDPGEVRFERLSLWQEHWKLATGTLVFIMLQFALLLWLALLLRNKRQLVAKLSTTQSQLEDTVGALTAANRQLSLMSYVDGMTGLANRRRFDEVLETEFQRFKRYQIPFSLLLLDLDHFKNFNDHYGHVAGDECLAQIGHFISSVVSRPTDLAARYGGEEFGVILSGTDGEGAYAIAERLRQGVSNLRIPHATSPTASHVTISIGMLTADDAELASTTELIHRCDAQLYLAKEQGRNRISRDSPETRAIIPSGWVPLAGE